MYRKGMLFINKKNLCTVVCAILMTVSLSGCAEYTDEFYGDVLNNVAASSSSSQSKKEDTTQQELKRIEIDTSAVRLSNSTSKLCQSGKVEIQTGKFTQSQSCLEGMIKNASGYIEKMKLSAGDFDSDRERVCDYTIRIPQKNFPTFMQGLDSIGHVKSQTEETENLNESYYDTEARLDALKEKQNRLKELISTVTSVDELLNIEAELNDAEYKIDSLESALRSYDDMETFATVELSIREMYKMDTDEDLSFGYRVSAGVVECFHNARSFIQNILIFMSKNILAVLFLGGLCGIFAYSKVKETKEKYAKEKEAQESHKKESDG